MKAKVKLCALAALMGGLVVGTAMPANAQVDFSIGIGVPAFNGYYDYHRPCWWYRRYDLPAPMRCYDYFEGVWGPSV